MAKILVGISAGTDSSTVLALLKSQGHEVTGCLLKLHIGNTVEDVCDIESGSAKTCCTQKDVIEAAKICEKLGVNFIVQSWKDLFEKKVVNPYIEGLKNGINLNPCVDCNTNIKIPALCAIAAHLGYDYVATGHYARIQNGKIARAVNVAKDQSYFLYNVPQEFISHLMFPLGGIDSKETVREMARNFGLGSVAEKEESMNLCFTPNGKETFLSKHGFEISKGNMTTIDGEILGKHNGFWNFVPGQRARLSGVDKPRYVLNVIPSTNTVVVGTKEEISTKFVKIRNCRIDFNGGEIEAVLRYHGNPVKVSDIENNGDNTYTVKLENEVFGVSAGQSLVFYENDVVVGGGIIC